MYGTRHYRTVASSLDVKEFLCGETRIQAVICDRSKTRAHTTLFCHSSFLTTLLFLIGFENLILKHSRNDNEWNLKMTASQKWLESSRLPIPVIQLHFHKFYSKNIRHYNVISLHKYVTGSWRKLTLQRGTRILCQVRSYGRNPTEEENLLCFADLNKVQIPETIYNSESYFN